MKIYLKPYNKHFYIVSGYFYTLLLRQIELEHFFFVASVFITFPYHFLAIRETGLV